jgi:hypothetical protein
MNQTWNLDRIDNYDCYTLRYSVLSDTFCIWNGLFFIKSFKAEDYERAVKEIKKLSGVDRPQVGIIPMYTPPGDLDLDNVALYGNIDGDNLLSSVETSLPDSSPAPSITSEEPSASVGGSDVETGSIDKEINDLNSEG